MRQVNLIPVDLVLRDEVYFRLQLWLAVYVGLGLLILSCFIVQRQIMNRIDAKVNRLEDRNRMLQARYEEIRELQKKQAELEGKANAVQGLLAGGDFTRMFIELEKAMTPSIWLTHVSLEKHHRGSQEEEEGQWTQTGYFVVKKPESRGSGTAKSFARGTQVVVRGFSLSHDDLAQFIHSLERSMLFCNVNLRHSRTGVREKDKIEFEIDLQY